MPENRRSPNESPAHVRVPHRFLRHIERCTVLMFMIDMAAVDGREPAEDYATLLAELGAYDESLLVKPRVVVANKMDLPESADQLVAFREKHEVEIIQISCQEETGLTELKDTLRTRVRQHAVAPVAES